MNFKNWRKTATLLHRDVGYFFAGVVVVYAISGIALNHKEDWDLSFVVERLEVETPYRADNKDTVTRESVTRLLEEENISDTYRGHDFPSASRVRGSQAAPVLLPGQLPAPEPGQGVDVFL